MLKRLTTNTMQSNLQKISNCNPDANATAFQAKYLVTINDDELRIASEGQLSALKSDLDQYMDSQS